MIYEPFMFQEDTPFRMLEGPEFISEYRLFCKENRSLIRIFIKCTSLSSFSFCVQNLGGPNDNIVLKSPSSKYFMTITDPFEKAEKIENIYKCLEDCLGIKINNA